VCVIIKMSEQRRKDVAKFGAETGGYDKDIYGAAVDRDELLKELPTDREEDDRYVEGGDFKVADPEDEGNGNDPIEAMRETHGSGLVNTRIADRESEYHARRRKRMISPERGGDAFSGQAPSRTYADIMRERLVDDEEENLRRAIQKKKEEGTLEVVQEDDEDPPSKRQKRRRWDSTPDGTDGESKKSRRTTTQFDETPASGNFFGETPVSGGTSKWDATPVSGGVSSKFGETPATSSKFGETPAASMSRFGETPKPGSFDATPKATTSTAASSRWDATPVSDHVKSRWDETPQATQQTTTTTTLKKRSRWDETPDVAMTGNNMGGFTATPIGGAGMQTPIPGQQQQQQSTQQQIRYSQEMEARNRPLSDEELNAMFPSEGYKIVEPPASYVPVTPSRKLLSTPAPYGSSGGQTPGFHLVESTPGKDAYGIPAVQSDANGDLPTIKPEDYQYFSALMSEKSEDDMTSEEAKERLVMTLLLKIKNGEPKQRKSAMRKIIAKARYFGAAILFNQILPLLMSPTLEDQERHLLVKVVDRVLYKLDDLVRPYVHKILVVIEPLLIDEDYYARIEGREIISNLAKAAGLATMISTMRPDIDNLDEYVRNTTARAFAVVASSLGIPALLPFLKAVCQSRTSWQARHTGVKIVQQIAILMGCAVLPHLKQLVEIMEHGLVDDQQKVRTITALALSALAEAAHPYGIESFDSVLRPLWKGIRQHRGKALAAFLKAIGFIIPLMDSNYANYYTREVMVVLIRQFQSPDEEMKKIVLKVVKQCVSTNGVEVQYVVEKILPDFFKHFWVRRMALDRRNYRQLVETTVELSNKVGLVPIVSRIVDDLRDESEPYRRMVMETIDSIFQNLGAADVDERLEEKLVDGILYAFQEQTSDDTIVMLNGFSTVVNALGIRAKPYLPQICGTYYYCFCHTHIFSLSLSLSHSLTLVTPYTLERINSNTSNKRRYHQVETEPQVCESSYAGCRSYFRYCCSDDDM